MRFRPFLDLLKKKNKKNNLIQPLVSITIFFGALFFLFQNCGQKFRSAMDLPSTAMASTQGTSELEILAHPNSQDAYVGETVYLRVTAVSTKNLTYQWFKNKVAIQYATNPAITINSATTTDSGSYTVKINTISTSVESNAAVVRIQNSPALDVAPAIQTQPQAVSARLGEFINLTVSATGFPSPTFKWFHDGVEILGQTSNSLQILSAQMSDAGQYYAKATNRLGSANTTVVTVTVQEMIEQVRIVTALRNLTKAEGDALSGGDFCVNATGGALRYSWKKTGSSASFAATPCLIISTLGSSDAGTYEVTVSNSVSTEKSTAVLTVNARQIAPVISQPPQSATAVVGSTQTFTVVAVGNPAPQYRWSKNEIELANQNSATLTLSNLQLTDAGNYSVRIFNSLGSIKTTPVALTVRAQEVAPALVTRLPATFGVIVATPLAPEQFCVTATGTNLVYTWKKTGSADLAPYNRGTRCYEIPSFMAADAGAYEVKIENTLGSVVSTGTLSIAEPSCSILSEQGVVIGSGKKSWNGTGYSDCRAITCVTDYHVEMNTCLSNTKSCPVLNGTGQSLWDGTGYGTCVLVSCNTPTYIQSGSSCVLASSMSVFSTTVKPIVESKCLSCHRSGGLGQPMSSSDNFASRYININKKLNNTGELPYMPPWYVDNSGSCGSFRLDGGLLPNEKSAILNWINNPALVQNGVPKGQEANIPMTAPPLLTFGNDSTVHTTTMSQSYTMPLMSDEYRCFVLDSVTPTDQYAIGYEMVPGNPAIVHHAILGVFETATTEQSAIAKQGQDGRPGYQCFGELGEANHVFIWAPGSNTQFFPPGTGIKIGGGRKLVIQIHYNRATATNYTDQTTVRLKLAPTVSAPAQWWMIGNLDATIPARTSNFSTSHTDPVTSAMTIYGYFPHMHLYGKTIRTELISQNKCLINIPNWDFHFQLSYFPIEPINLQAGDMLKTTCVYDSSSSNSPIVNGFNSDQEMCFNFIYVSSVKSTQRFSTQILGSSGSNTSKSLDVRLVMDSLHSNLTGYVFVRMRLNSVNYYLQYDLSGVKNKWVIATQPQSFTANQRVARMPNYIDVNIFSSYNISAYKGAEVSIGYGMGSSDSEAFNEMTVNSRIQKIYDVP